MRQTFLLVLLCLLPNSAFAAELTLLAGYRNGGPSMEVPFFCITTPCPQPTVEARDSESFGLILDLPFRDRLMFEVVLSHQSSDFEEDFAVDILLLSLPSRFDLTYLHFGLLRQWQQPRVSPFAAAGIGIAQVEAEAIFLDSVDENRLSASLAGGVRIDLKKWLGFRLEGRGYWADLPVSLGDDLFQFEVSSGLIFNL